MVRFSWAGVGVQVRSRPGRGQPVAGELVTQEDQTFEVEESCLLVLRPRTLVAKRAVTLGDASVYDPQTGELGEPETDLNVAAREEVDFLHYGSEGVCYLGLRGLVYLANCPERRDFRRFDRQRASELQPDEQEWWVYVVEGDLRGWVEVEPGTVYAEIEGP